MGEVVVPRKPKVSVVMPVYNTEPYVRDAVESVLNQTLNDIEILLINDGSTDNGLAILEELKSEDSRVRLYTQSNQGLSRTRNRGLEEACGEYIYFMDSDDLIDPLTLEACYTRCSKENLDFVFFEADAFSDDSSLSSLSFDYSRSVMSPNVVGTGKDFLMIQLKAYEFRSSVCLNFISFDFLRYNQLTFYPNILHEDQLFSVLMYLRAMRVSYIDQPFFHRRVRPNSIMTVNYSWKNIGGYLTVAEELLKFRKKYEADRNIIDLFLAQMLDAAIWRAHQMSLRDRLRLFMLSISRWRHYIKTKTLFVLLFKKYLK